MGCLNELFTAGDLLLSEPERARYAMEDSRERARYQEWDESKHTRTEDGKFGSGDSEEEPEEEESEDDDDFQLLEDEEASRGSPAEKAAEQEAKILSREFQKSQARAERQNEKKVAKDTDFAEKTRDTIYKQYEKVDQEEYDGVWWEDKAWEEADKIVVDKLGYDPLDDESIQKMEFEGYKKRYVEYRKNLDAIYDKHGIPNPWVRPEARKKYAKYAKGDSDERWITLNGGSGEDGHGGTRVKVKGDEIVAGPAGLAKKGVKSLDDLGKGKEEKKEPPAPKSPDDFRQDRLAGIKSEMAKLRPGDIKWRELADEEKALKSSGVSGDSMSPEMRASFEANERRLDQVDQLRDAHQSLLDSHGAHHPATKAVKKSLDDLRGDTAARKASLASQKRQAKLKALPPFQRQMVEGLWEEHEARNPGASREEFEDFLLSPKQALTNPGAQLTTGEPASPAPKGPPPRKPKTPPKRDPKDNLWPYVGLDKSKPPEQPFQEMTNFEPDEKPAAQTPPPRDTRTVADLDRELAVISQRADAAKAARKAARGSLWQSFQGMLGKMLKTPDQAEYEPGAFGTMQRLIAKSLHAKRGKKELYQKQAFNIFVEGVRKYAEDEHWVT